MTAYRIQGSRIASMVVKTQRNDIALKLSDKDSWAEDADCANFDYAPDMFPNELDRVAVRIAKDFCQSCPVRDVCLKDAMDRGDRHGIWGGMDFNERVAHRATLRQADVTPPAL